MVCVDVLCLKYGYVVFKFVGVVWDFGEIVDVGVFLCCGEGVVIGCYVG